MTAAPDPNRFRQALGRFATGVTVVTALDPRPPSGGAGAAGASSDGSGTGVSSGGAAEIGGRPVGFACQAFAALSLEPPLVLFCPSKTSGTWPTIEQAGRFCINVLGASQQHVSQIFGTPGKDRFGSVDWHLSPGGSPIIDGVLTWIDCVIDHVYAAGDHYVVIGHVTALDSPETTYGDPGDDRPLVFYRGAYTATELVPSAGPDGPTPPHAIVQALRTWPAHQDWL